MKIIKFASAVILLSFALTGCQLGTVSTETAIGVEAGASLSI